MRRLLLASSLSVLCLLSACASELDGLPGDAPEGDDYHGEIDQEAPYYDDTADSWGTVAEQEAYCTTQGTVHLSVQVLEEMECMAPGSLVLLDQSSRILFSGNAVLPFFAPEAADDLMAAANEHTIQINSGFRSVVQQHLLYGWYQQGRCGIGIAAYPGRSRHESGRALDLHNYSSVRATMAANLWGQPVPSDHVHFEHGDSPDLRGMDVMAYQRLWNRNHPEDVIDEDGIYGPETAARIDQSPAGGFAIGASCDDGNGHGPFDDDALRRLVYEPAEQLPAVLRVP